jgi:HSP20 family protein
VSGSPDLNHHEPMRAERRTSLIDDRQEVQEMTLVRRTSPLGELVSLRHAMDRLFEDSYVRPRAWSFSTDGSVGLPLDIRNTADTLVVEAALPGVKPEDVEITIEDGTLRISAESREEREETTGEMLISEIRRGSVSRSVALPQGLEADKASASFENGVLRLSIPRAEAVKPRQIRITPTIDGQSTSERSVDAGAKPVDAGTASES